MLTRIALTHVEDLNRRMSEMEAMKRTLERLAATAMNGRNAQYSTNSPSDPHQ